MYLDRIFEPLVSIQNESLRCAKDHLIGVKIVYKKEHRVAFRIVPYSIRKEAVDS
jgi:hypothetical protein